MTEILPAVSPTTREWLYRLTIPTRRIFSAPRSAARSTEEAPAPPLVSALRAEAGLRLLPLPRLRRHESLPSRLLFDPRGSVRQAVTTTTCGSTPPTQTGWL